MRHARNADMIVDDAKGFVGFNLGADYCAEHEWGIRGIRKHFGIEPERLGIDGRSATVAPDTVLFRKVRYNEKECYILIHCSKYLFDEIDKLGSSEISNLELYSGDLESNGISTSWDERSFAILVTKDYKTELEELYKALISCDATIFVSSTMFNNNGLNVLIKSRVPKDVANDWLKKDLDAVELRVRANATGIYEKLKAAGKQYFALSPRWKDEKKKEVIFWLNPMKQNKDNFGWFTVKDLEDWIEGKGRIPRGENN